MNIAGDFASVVATLEGIVDPIISVMMIWLIYIILFYMFKMISGRRFT